MDDADNMAGAAVASGNDIFHQFQWQGVTMKRKLLKPAMEKPHTKVHIALMLIIQNQYVKDLLISNPAF
jgi:hypothetical protein